MIGFSWPRHAAGRVEAAITHTDQNYGYLNTELNLKIRAWKEALFKTGACVWSLEANSSTGRIQLDEFLARQETAVFEGQLQKRFHDVLGQAPRSFRDAFHQGGVKVVLTGGGSSLPMVQRLAEGDITIDDQSFNRQATDLVPEEFADEPELSAVYPQLAVAIGGSLPDLIEERRALAEFMGQSHHNVRVQTPICDP